MARLGELLVAAKLLTVEQVEQALRAQVVWGGRLGTNLVELGMLDLEALALVLGRQHRLPAVQARHFDKADREIQGRLSSDLAERFSCVPLRRVGPKKAQLAIAAISPLDARALVLIAQGLDVDARELLPAICPELRIRYHLERIYGIPRSTRFLRARGKTIPPFPQFRVLPPPPDEPDLILPADTQEISAQLFAEQFEPEPIVPTITVEDLEFEDYTGETSIEDLGGRERRRYVHTIADPPPPTEAERQAALGRIAIRKVPRLLPVEYGDQHASLAEAIRAIRRGTDRDKVADLIITSIERFVPDCEAALLLVVRGGTAIGWKGFSRSGGAVLEIGVPLDQPGLVPRVIQAGSSVRGPSPDLSAIDRRLLEAMGAETGDLAVVPVTIANQVMCLVALVLWPHAGLADAESVAGAAGVAFARLMRDASR